MAAPSRSGGGDRFRGREAQLLLMKHAETKQETNARGEVGKMRLEIEVESDEIRGKQKQKQKVRENTTTTLKR